jgi:multiple sugar transport system substrate-binding protein
MGTMRKNRVRLLSGAVVGAMVLSLCGCGEKDILDPDNPVTITVWNYYNGDQLDAFDNLVDEFNNSVGAEKGIIVKSNSQGSVSDLETNVMAAVEGKVGADEVPNIFAGYADTAYAIDQLGEVVDLKNYLTEDEISQYIDGYMEEGDFSGNGEIKIFPIAKSTEVFVMNKTDWDKFADTTGATYDDLATVESLVDTAQKYYEWTDAQTPDIPDDGKALYGRDAMANYMLIGAMQLGTEIFQVDDGSMTLNFDKETVRKLWDNYYVPYVKGYFASSGKFRSDDVKTGNIIAFTGSTSGSTFFPDQISLSDTESYSIENVVLPAPQFEGSTGYAVQQGAGMVVTKGTEAEITASVEFLKWFTEESQNISFSAESGYMPVKKAANDMSVISANADDIDTLVNNILTVGIDTVNNNTLYTPTAFEDGNSARNVLEYAMSDIAVADRETVVNRIAEGQTMEEAVKDFVSDDYFEAWYEDTLAKLEAYEK